MKKHLFLILAALCGLSGFAQNNATTQFDTFGQADCDSICDGLKALVSDSRAVWLPKCVSATEPRIPWRAPACLLPALS